MKSFTITILTQDQWSKSEFIRAVNHYEAMSFAQKFLLDELAKNPDLRVMTVYAKESVSR